jgi:hypothetical protein
MKKQQLAMIDMVLNGKNINIYLILIIYYSYSNAVFGSLDYDCTQVAFKLA